VWAGEHGCKSILLYGKVQYDAVSVRQIVQHNSGDGECVNRRDAEESFVAVW
jgi:hypothetical protein